MKENATEIRIELNGLRERMSVEFQIEVQDLNEEETSHVENFVNAKNETIFDVWVDNSFSTAGKKYYQLMRMGFYIHDITGFLFYIKEPNNKKQYLLANKIKFLEDTS